MSPAITNGTSDFVIAGFVMAGIPVYYLTNPNRDQASLPAFLGE